ncbi:MAG: extracellular solute-binding protein [Lachnospiraceae bacterium]|nr:extracellular solute-binding protein [Lachnospiraceae bacterium]
MKKITVILLAFAMMLCLAACGEETQQQSSADTEGSTQEAKKDVERITDFEGYSITVADWYSEDEEATEFSTSWQEFVHDYNKSVMDKYNFTYQVKNIAKTGDYTELVPAKILSGDTDVQLYYFFQGYILPSISQNLLWDLNELDSFDPTDEKWSKISMDTFTFGDKLYAVDVAATEPRIGMFYNKRLLQDAGLDPDLPYDLQKNGEWTWAKFEEICAKVTKDKNNDGITDVWAVSSTYGNMAISAVWSNGAAFVSKDENGKFVDTTDTTEFLQAMEWLQKLAENGWFYSKPEGGSGNYALEAFQNGTLAFLPYNYWLTDDVYIKECVDDWGWVYCPYGPSANGVTMSVQCNGFGIPINVEKEEAEKIFQAFDLMTDLTTKGSNNDWTIEGADEFKETYWQEAWGDVMKDSRAVEETLYSMVFDESTWNLDYYRMIPGYNATNYTSDIINLKKTAKEKVEEMRPANVAAVNSANVLVGE